MTQQELIDRIKGQAPTAATSAVVAVIAVLALGGSPTPPDVPALPAMPAKAVAPDKPTKAPRQGREGQETRLVACGDSTVAKVAGDDTQGVIALGTGAGGSCTLLFSAPWQGVPPCAVNGGTVASVTEHELAITGATDAVAYRCGEPK